MLCYVMLSYVILCYVMLRYVMSCYVMLCYVMLVYLDGNRMEWISVPYCTESEYDYFSDDALSF
jgi:hypothetical protein